MPVRSIFLHFDPHQFAARRNRVVSSESQIAFTDYNRMHTEYRKTFRDNRWIPQFANDDKQLRRVLAQRAFSYYRAFNKRGHNEFEQVPEALVADLPALTELVNQTLKKLEGNPKYFAETNSDMPDMQLGMHWQHIGAVKRAGSYLALITAIAYRSWRQGWHSTDIAASLGMTPWSVREHLYRLREIATRLGYTFDRHHSCKSPELRDKHKCKPRPPKPPKPPRSAIVVDWTVPHSCWKWTPEAMGQGYFLYYDGHSCAEIAEALGVSKPAAHGAFHNDVTRRRRLAGARQ